MANQILFFFLTFASAYSQVIKLRPGLASEEESAATKAVAAGFFGGDEVTCRGLGIFNSGPPFYDGKLRPISVAPDCALADQIVLHLNTRENPTSSQILNPRDASSISQSKINVSKPVKILIHGFNDNYESSYWKDLARLHLAYEDCNVVRVDWSQGCVAPYYQATANTRLVGTYIGKLILVLKETFGLDLNLVHIIGHSLGAHTAGYAGTHVATNTGGLQVGRITGLDPAGPYFSYTSEAVRLDPSDAKVVDTIISDGEKIVNGDFLVAFGSPQSMGHINFRPNGGFNQPGCNRNLILKEDDLGSKFQLHTSRSIFSDAIDMVTSVAEGMFRCNHPRAVFLFQESLTRSLPAMRAFQCDSYDKFLGGDCFSCSSGRCTSVGISADLSIAEKNQVKDFFFTTMKASPYATSLYEVVFSLSTVDSNGKKISAKQNGKVHLVLKGTKSQTGRRKLTDSAVELLPGRSYASLIDVKEDLGQILSLGFLWEKESGVFSWFFGSQRFVYLDSDIRVTDQNGKVVVYRLGRTKVPDGVEVEAIRLS